MARQNKITISFSREYRDIYEFLKRQGNCSRYICEAVRKQTQGEDLESRIVFLVNKVLQDKPVQPKDDNDLLNAVTSFDL